MFIFGFLRKLYRVVKIASGAFLYCAYVLVFGSYRGGAKLMCVAQMAPASFVGSIAVAFLESPPAKLANDFAYQRDHRNRERLSPHIAALYSDDSLQGYGDEVFLKGGDNLHSQQRGQILPLLEEKLAANSNCPLKVVELGIGNGDVIAHLATEFPQHEFLGIDFSTATAAKKHGHIPNLHFMNGYVLELLEKSMLTGDLIYASSTLTLMLPKELADFVNLLRTSGFSEIVSNEPTWGPYFQENSNSKISYYMDDGCWFHNYCGYFSQAGFQPERFAFFPYKHPMSPRPDIRLSLVAAKIAG